MNRRALVKSSVGVAGGVALSRYAGISVIRAQSVARYELIELVAPKDSIAFYSGPYHGAVRDINNAGDVGGELTVSNVKVSPVIWSADGKGTKLKSGEFGGGINALSDGGYSAGYAYGGRLGYNPDTFYDLKSPRLWKDGEAVDLTHPDGVDKNIATVADVNEAGTMIGKMGVPTEFGGVDMIATIWEDAAGAFMDSVEDPTLDPQVINAAGVVLGTARETLTFGDSSTSRNVPVLWTSGEMETLEFPAEFPAPKSIDDVTAFPNAQGLTDDGLGVVVFTREVERATMERSYIYDRGKPEMLESRTADLIHVLITGVSPAGMMVGKAASEDRSATAFIVWADGKPTDLSASLVNETGLRPTFLWAINDTGEIVASAVDAEGKWHGVVLRPVN